MRLKSIFSLALHEVRNRSCKYKLFLNMRNYDATHLGCEVKGTPRTQAELIQELWLTYTGTWKIQFEFVIMCETSEWRSQRNGESVRLMQRKDDFSDIVTLESWSHKFGKQLWSQMSSEEFSYSPTRKKPVYESGVIEPEMWREMECTTL